MRRFAIFFVIVITLTSCIITQKQPKTLDQVKVGLDCVEYKEGMDWNQISDTFGTPPITPLSEPGTDLSKNVRGYEDMKIFFHTERRKVKEGEKVRFHEVVNKIEVCKKK